MTGLFGVPILRRPEQGRPTPLDGPMPDVVKDFQTDFVVDWQVADKREGLARTDLPLFEIFYS